MASGEGEKTMVHDWRTGTSSGFWIPVPSNMFSMATLKLLILYTADLVVLSYSLGFESAAILDLKFGDIFWFVLLTTELSSPLRS